MAVVYVFVTFQLLCHHALMTVADTKATNLTFYPQILTWNDARDACHHHGGYLVEIQDETKHNVVIHLMHKLTESMPLSRNIAIGLVQPTTTPGEFYWAESCKPLLPNNWSSGVYPGGKPGKKCAKIHRKTNKLAWSKCDIQRYYICEMTSDDKCPYETHNQTTLLEDGVLLHSTNHSVSLSECFDRCDVMTSRGGVECWAFSVNFELPEQCTLFFTADPYLVTNLTYQYHDIKHTLFLRHCYYGSLGEPYTLIKEENLSPVPEINCTNMPTQATDDMSTIDTTTSAGGTTMSTGGTTTSTEGTATKAEGTKRSTEDTTSIFPVTSQTTRRTLLDEYSASTTVTSTVASTETNVFRISGRVSTPGHSPGLTFAVGTSHLTTRSNKNRLTSELLSKSVSSLGATGSKQVAWTTTASREDRRTIVTYSTTDESPHDHRTVCYCPCRKQWSTKEKHRILQELLTNLTVNKTHLSSFRRKYESVMDFSPVSVGMGCTGIVFVVLTLALILLCDVTTALSR